MPEDTTPAIPIPLPDLPPGLALPTPPVLALDATMQAALEAALAQAQAQLAMYMAAFTQSPPPLPISSADTVPAAGDSVIGPAAPIILPAPGATLKGAGSLLHDTIHALMPLDFPMLQPASLGGWLAGSTGGGLSATFLDMIPAGAAIDLGDGISLHFSDMAESNGTEH